MEDAFATERAGDLGATLSKRERQILSLAARGLTDNGIAHRLGISLATVGTYWGRIRIKMGPHNRAELVASFVREEAAKTVDELRSENLSLVSQLDHCAQAAASLELFKSLVEAAPDAILAVNERGTIELTNEEGIRMFGYSRAELLGMHVSTLVPNDLRLKHQEHMADYFSSPSRKRMGAHLATMAVRKDGTEFPMATTLSIHGTSAGQLVICFVRDVSYRFELAEGA